MVRGRRLAPPRSWAVRAARRLRGADRLGRSGLGRGGRRVLELLLRPKQSVEDLLAQALAERKRQARANHGHEEDAAATPLLLLPAQLVGRLAERNGRVAELPLDLLVLSHRPDGVFAVGHPRVNLSRGLESRAKVVAQVVVLNQTLDVLVRPNRPTSRYGSGSGLRGSLLSCHRSPRIGFRVRTL